MGWRDKYKVHPSADVFPMMPDDELDALAADIKANGLREPIAFWGVNKGTPQFERLLCDGRNRGGDGAGWHPGIVEPQDVYQG